MHIRPHLDYCDVIFHIPILTNDFDSSMSLNFSMGILERTQYQAALAITGTWKGTNRNKIYEELGLETLDHRRYFHQLVLIYKIVNALTPLYLKDPIPLRNRFSHRLPSYIPTMPYRTDRYLKSFFPNSIKSWNNLDLNVRNAPSLAIFKKRLINLIRPPKKEIFNITNRKGLQWIFQLRVGLSDLKKHKSNHNFKDITDDSCSCNTGTETTEHFLLSCPNYILLRTNMLNDVKSILDRNNIDIDTINQVNLLLYGYSTLSYSDNHEIIELTVKFISLSGRLT